MFHVEHKHTHIEVVDHFLTKEKFKIQKTSVPGLLQTIPTPTKEDIIKYYKSERYVSHNSRKNGVFFFFYRFFGLLIFILNTVFCQAPKTVETFWISAQGKAIF